MLSFIIKEEENDQTLVSFLKKRFRTTPSSLIYKLFRTKKIKVNDKSIRYYHYRLKIGEKVEIYDNYLKKTSLDIYPVSHSKLYFEIIYEDQNILIVLKEHGITMTSLDNAVRTHIFEKDPAKYQKQVQEYFILTAVHRLDKLTKGLVIYPKNSLAKKILYNAIGDKEKITKKYLALCESSPTKKALPNYISGHLGKNPKEQKMDFFLTEPTFKSKKCALEIKRLGKKNSYQLLEITLHTGRKHQIRSILSFFDMPIVGDKKYGSKTEIKDKIQLFAYEIIFKSIDSPLNYLNKKSFKIENAKLKLFII